VERGRIQSRGEANREAASGPFLPNSPRAVGLGFGFGRPDSPGMPSDGRRRPEFGNVDHATAFHLPAKTVLSFAKVSQ
jgi:hypothetical protein